MPSHDPVERRRAKRSGREKGCWTYVPAEALVAAGVEPGGPLPWYRVWPGSRGSAIVQFYKEG